MPNLQRGPFCTILFRKCQENKLFKEIELICKSILESELRIKSIQDLFEYLITLPFRKNFGSIDTKRLWRLWKESFSQMDPNLRELFLYRIKLFLEREIEENVKSFSEYEKLRFKSRDNPHAIVIEGQCENCGFCTIKKFDILDYMEKMNLLSTGPIATDRCSKCKQGKHSVKFAAQIRYL